MSAIFAITLYRVPLTHVINNNVTYILTQMNARLDRVTHDQESYTKGQQQLQHFVP